MAIWDVGGNHLTFGVWEGISTSPINAMHAGYGVGGILSVQLSKNFIKFNKKGQFNSSSTISKNEINIQTPFNVVASIGILMSICFVFSQLIESNNTKKFKINSLSTEPDKQSMIDMKMAEINKSNSKQSFIRGLFFGGKQFDSKGLCYMSTQIGVLTGLFFLVSGFATLSSRFMLTYLTMGPANFSVESYAQLQTLYWTSNDSS